MKFINYRKCSTCVKARKHLEKMNVEFEDRDILEGISETDLLEYVEKSQLDIKKFFNTSGLIYKENNYKEKLNDMTFDDKIKVLSQTPMLVKRPILVMDDQVLVGYDPLEYDKVGMKYGKNK